MHSASRQVGCMVQRLCRRKVGWGGVSRVSTALCVLEMTELTPTPCHILFSASLRSVRGQQTENRKSLQRSHVPRGEMVPKPADAKGPKPGSFIGLGPDAVHQRSPIG